MNINEFREIASNLAKKEGKSSKNAKEVLGKITRQFSQVSENNYECAKEGWNQNLDYYNNTLNLIYGLVIGIFSAVFMQSIFEILKIIIKEEFYFFIFTFLAIISLFILVIISFVLFKSMKQSDNMRKRHERIMKASLKIKKNSEKATKDLNL